MDRKQVLQAIRKVTLQGGLQDNLSQLVERMDKVRYVLLGEASHGTSEYYTFRAELTKRLIQQQGIRFIAVEGDWPSCYRLNRYVKGRLDKEDAKEAFSDFNRWPAWMWANQEILEFAEWLRHYNAEKPTEEQVGFFGMDVYSLWESMDAILTYLQAEAPDSLPEAKRAFECLEPFGRNEQSYGVSAALYGEGCEDEVLALLYRLTDRWMTAGDEEDRDSLFNAEMNAMAVKGAEAYYRSMIRHNAESWNIRDRHMANVLENLMEYYGPQARGVIWAHNTHIGDARATDMIEEGMINLGQLLREKHPGDVYAVGFGSYEGTVIAGKEWGAPSEVMQVPQAMADSWEELLHQSGADDKILIFDNREEVLETKPLGHRAIGVVYHPAWEQGNYVPTVVAKRYDAFVYLNRTKALSPLMEEKTLYL
ncbi:erythromycin esterase family protein [Paenibacillus puerhi]|uniref:erythromycin esterase family protein n=1 Tax=Paenibacillus puerhi TaxID=2692622 RepID=UPI001359C1D6|nr:erythromycin esterase family protein [Paenibacillus puerhi]